MGVGVLLSDVAIFNSCGCCWVWLGSWGSFTTLSLGLLYILFPFRNESGVVLSDAAMIISHGWVIVVRAAGVCPKHLSSLLLIQANKKPALGRLQLIVELVSGCTIMPVCDL